MTDEAQHPTVPADIVEAVQSTDTLGQAADWLAGSRDIPWGNAMNLIWQWKDVALDAE